LRIPEVGVDLNVRMLVTFIVEKDGTMTDISVSKDPGFGLRKEAIRMMSAVEEKWLPGLKDGEPVRVRYALPIKVVAKAPAEPQNIEE
jgi:periplasmic protein TonB